MKIIQISDLHIDLKDEYPFNINVRKNFTDILKEIRSLQPDHLIISGDLCYRTGEAPIYKWIKNRLDLQDFPYSIIAGNHDESMLMAKTFNLEHLLTETEFFFAKKIGKFLCLFLDSSKGFHSDLQLKWLKRQLKNAKGDLIIFMHHPPIKAGIPFMDNKHALQDIDIIQEILLSYHSNISVFCGHYHVEKTLRIGNLMIQITPSCFYQMDQNEPEFKVDHHRIALRIIEQEKNSISSTVRYFDGNFIQR